ncbi:MAG: BC1872 family protein [Bacillota bacterium]
MKARLSPRPDRAVKRGIELEISKWVLMDWQARASLIVEKVLGDTFPGPEFDPSGDIRSTWLVVAKAEKSEASYWENDDERGTWYVGIALRDTDFRRSFSESFGDAVCVAALNAVETRSDRGAGSDEHSKTGI